MKRGLWMTPGTSSGELWIRLARKNDLAALTAALEPEISATQVNRRLEESRLGYREMLVAELNGQAVGTVSVGGVGFQRPGSLSLFALDVGEVYRNRGIGTALVKAVEAVAADRGLDKVNLEVAIDNENAIRLYERLGFRRLGDPVMDHCQQTEAPSWVMVKELE